MLKSKLTLIAALTGVFATSNAQQFSEIFVNPPGPSADAGREFIELKATPGFSWNGYKIAVIDGDATVAGTIDVVIDLAGQTSGSNGILLIRKSGTPFLPAPSGSSNIMNLSLSNATNLTDLENGSTTFLLGSGAFPATSTDFDTANNGTFNASLLGSFALVDAVSWEENDLTTTADYGYADNLGFTNFGPDLGFTPDFAYRVQNSGGTAFLGFVAGDALAPAVPNDFGPWGGDAVRFVSAVPGYTFANFNQLDPGNLNQNFSGGVTLALTLNVGGYAGDYALRTADVTYTDSASVAHTFTNQSISASGVVNITLPGSAALGAGTLRVKMSHSLTKQDNFTLAAGANTFTSVQINGDVNSDDFVGFDDFDLLSGSFNLSQGDSGYVELADLNGDLFVGFDDFDILSANFNSSGD